MNRIGRMLIALTAGGLLCAAMLPLSAQTADKAEATEDVYVTEEADGDGAYTDGPAPEADDADSSIRRSKKGFLGFGTDLPPVAMGEGSIFLQGAVSSKVSQHPVTFSYYPTPDLFTLKFRYQGINNVPRFDARARERLRKAYAIYEKDFAAHKLDAKSKHSRDAYGKMPGDVRWGAVNATSAAHPAASLGYQIIKKGAYFTITYADAASESPGESRGEGAHFVGRTYFFTRAQMVTILEAMDEEKMAASLKGYEVKQVDEDTYQ